MLEPVQRTLGVTLDMLLKASDLPLSDPGPISKVQWIFIVQQLETLERELSDAKLAIFARLHGVSSLDVPQEVLEDPTYKEV